MSGKNDIFKGARISAFIISVAVFSFALSYFVLAWTEPSSTPPAGNVSAPLNASSVSQTKAGSLYFSTDSGANSGVGTSSPNAKLGVYDASDALLRLMRSGTASNYSFNLGTDGKFIFKDQNGNSRLAVDTAGNVGIGTASPQGALDITSTAGAFIVPRMTTAQRNALASVNGMIIYNTSTNQFNFRENGAWVLK
jgi:hypothetical protein